jgi:ABC-2 type transport system permease protein
MRNLWTIASREYKHFFLSPIAYVFLLVLLITLGLYQFLEILSSVQTQQYIPDPTTLIQIMVFPVFFLGIPAITMRSIAEENRNGTLELLLTAPLTDTELIIGKWLGGFLFVLTAIATTWVYPLILNQLVQPGIDQGVLMSAYLGVVLITASWCAIGVLVSSLFNNPIASLVATYGIIILLWVIGAPGQFISGPAAAIFTYLSFPNHFFSSYLTGLIKLEDILYYLSLTAFALFFSTITIDIRRWH